jgi:hypothetical protein
MKAYKENYNKTNMNTCFDTKNYDKTKEWLEGHCNKKFSNTLDFTTTDFTTTDFTTLEILLKQHPSYETWKFKIPASFHIKRSKTNNAIQLYVSFKKSQQSTSQKSNSIAGITKYRIVSWVMCSKQKSIVDETTGEIKRKGPKPKSTEEQLTMAMRHAIRKQISNFRRDNSHPACELCNKDINSKLCNNDVYEVDHYPVRFAELKSTFIEIMAAKNKPYPTEFLFHPKKGVAMFKKGTKETEYYDKKWKLSWQNFHLKNASYRYLCPTHNKQTSKRINN